MVSEGSFERIVNHILESADQLAARLEDGVSVLMTGKLPESEQSSTSNPNQHQQGHHDVDDVLMEIDEDMMGSPLESMADGVLSDIMSRQAGPQTFFEHIDAFRTAIRWTEPFILSLLSFQVIMFFICLWASKRGRGMTSRIVILLLVGGLVRCSEQLNGYAARNWETFATQNYFDRSGVFVGIFFCGPLLLDSFMMLILLLREASSLLVEVKRMEIKKKQKAEKSKKEGSRGKKSKESDKKQD